MLSDFSQKSSLSLLDTFGKATAIAGLGQKAAPLLKTFLCLSAVTVTCLRRGGEWTLRLLIEEMNYWDYISELYKTPEAAFRKIENLDGFVDSMSYYESSGNAPSLHGFLETMALTGMMEEKEEKGGRGVTFISFHSSKGLKFPVVFIAGVEDEILPHKKPIHTSYGIEEERRLFYVGITRAMNELYIIYTDHRSKYGKETPSVPSRFLDEIPAEVMKKLNSFEKLGPDEEKAYARKFFDNIKAILGD